MVCRLSKQHQQLVYNIHINDFCLILKISDVGHFRAVIRQVYNRQGVHGFWRGNGLNLLKSSPEFAIKFSVYDYTKRRLKASRDDGRLNAIDRFVAGSTAGVVGQTFLYPLDARNTTIINHLCTLLIHFRYIGRRTTEFQGLSFNIHLPSYIIFPTIPWI